MEKIKKNEFWTKLDNAGKLYPSITKTRISTVFRLSVIIKNKVDEKKLQNSLDKVMKRFPYFNVNLHRGMFWYYFSKSEVQIKVEKEKYYPCMFLNYKKHNTFPFRVLFFENRISVEFSHSITDGSGAIYFLQELVKYYFELKNIKIPKSKEIINLDNEWEDSFKKYAKKNIPLPRLKKDAMHLDFELIKKGEHYIVTGIMESKKIKELAKSYDCTITQFIMVLVFETYQEYFFKHSSKKLGRVVLNIPINLRKIFPSNSMRNFFISLTPEIDLRLGEYNREEIIKYVKNYMLLNISEKNIIKIISRNVSNEKSLFVRIIPLFIKNIILKVMYKIFGDSSFTTGISNLGIVRFPKEIEDEITDVEFFPPPSKHNKIKTTIISFKEKMYITFGKLTNEKLIEKIFFRKLRKEGIMIKIKTNVEE